MGFFGDTHTINESGDFTTTTIPVRLSAALSVDTTVTITVVTTRPSFARAVENDDFRLSTKTLSFPAGSTSKTFTISGIPDQTTEREEIAYLRLQAPSGAPYQVRDLGSADLYREVEVVVGDTSQTPGLNFLAGAQDHDP